MTTDALKKQAREHEQNEEWEKALRLYRRSLDEMEPGREPEIALYNRVADLELRLGNVEAAIQQYEQAIDLYLEADLPNNAIAICRKILRNVPGRAETFLRMGEIRARQGFGVDARQNVLTYAEMMESRGDSGAATAALEELVTLFPADAEARVFLGERLVALGDSEGGLRHLLGAWQRLAYQESDEADMLEGRIRELDPDAEFPIPGDLEAEAAEGGDAPAEDWHRDNLPSHGLAVDFGGEDGPVERFLGLDAGEGGSSSPALDPSESHADAQSGAGAEAPDAGVDAYAFGEIQFGDEPAASADGEDMDGDDDKAGEGDLPDEGVAFGGAFGEVRGEEPGDDFELAFDDRSERGLALGSEVAVEDELGDEFGDESADEDEAAPLPLLGEEFGADPDDIAAHRAEVDRAHEEGDRELLLQALSGLAAAHDRAGEEVEARAVHEQVLQLDPRNAASLEALGRAVPGGAPVPTTPSAPVEEPMRGGGFVDLGALVLDEDEAPTTRWVVDDQRSGDEDADFAHMLSKFKAKVAQHITRDDARSSYDLGTAYLEMGLVDESIGMFQQALRAHPGHLASLEMLGQCFLGRDEPQVAIRVLERALQADAPVEDDLLGIYYFLAVSHERAGNRDEAREFYEKVFSLDINFKDVTDRLRALR